MKKILCFLVLFLFTLQNIIIPLEVSAYEKGKPSKFIAISAGSGVSVALKDDGSVWAWGDNINVGNNKVLSVPEKIKGLDNITAISAGDYHILALKKDGSVWSLGGNTYGQLGDGTRNPKQVPIKVKSLSNIVSITAGSMHSVALKKDGSVYCWGNNWYGQLGFSTSEANPTPVKCSGLSKIKSIAAKGNCTYALKSDGTVWELRNNFQSSYKPAKLPNLSKVTNIYIGESHAFAKTSNGSLYAWGNNIFGGLGNGTTDNQDNPIKVNLGSNIGYISLGRYYTIMLKKDGSVWSWGYNMNGYLGNGSTQDSLKPVKVNLKNIISIATGGEHTLALKSDGSIWSWGDNCDGELGNGALYRSPTPQKLAGINNVKSVTAGSLYNSIIKNDGSLWTSGLNNFIDSDLHFYSSFEKVNSIYNFKYIAKGVFDTIALCEDGSVCELTANEVPKRVPKLNNVIDISNMDPLYYALKKDGTVWYWGEIVFNDEEGNIGLDEITNPIRVKDLQDIVKIDTGKGIMIALKKDGTVYSWGDNSKSYHGGNFDNWIKTPTKINGLTNVVSISADPDSGAYAALKDDGTVYTWFKEEIKNSSEYKFTQPKIAEGFSDIVSIECGSNCILGIKKDGTLWVTGKNYDGQIGDETYESREKPVMINNLNNILSVSSNTGSTIALEKNGTIWVWGDNRYGQLGTGRTLFQTKPVKVEIK